MVLKGTLPREENDCEIFLPPGHALGHALYLGMTDDDLQASLQELNKLLGEENAVPMERFRPNVVVTGTLPWEEDDWETFTLSGPAHAACKFWAVMPCDRCKAGPLSDHQLCRAMTVRGNRLGDCSPLGPSHVPCVVSPPMPCDCCKARPSQ